MYIYYQPNPLRKSVGDCVVRALSALLDYGWVKTFLILVIECLVQFDMPSSDAVWGAILKHRGYRKYMVPDTCPDCYTIADFAEDNPHGLYAVGTGSHVVAVIDGDYMDSWNSGFETVSFYWRKEA